MAEEWKYECPQYVDFSDPNVLDPNISVSGNYFVGDLGAQSTSAEMTVAQQGEESSDVESDVIIISDSEEDVPNRPEIENKIEYEQVGDLGAQSTSAEMTVAQQGEESSDVESDVIIISDSEEDVPNRPEIENKIEYEQVGDLGAQSTSAEMTVAQQGEESSDVESDVIIISDSEEDVPNRPEIENKIEYEQESTYQAGPSVVGRNKEGNKRKSLATQDIKVESPYHEFRLTPIRKKNKEGNKRKSLATQDIKVESPYHEFRLTPIRKKNKEGNKRKALATQDRNVESPYHEFRLTPIRKKYAGLYQSTYVVGQSVASDKGKENTRKLYGLRLTPARKKHAKSCHLYTSMYLKEERISHGVRPVKTEDSKVSEDIPSVSVAMIKAEPAEEKLLPYHGKEGVQRRRVATEELKGPFANDKGKENTRKLYGLRLTPARKKHAKSCHLYTSMYLKEERISHGVRPVKTEDSKVSEDIPSVSVAMIKAEPAEEKLLPYHGKGGVQRRRVATEELKGPFANDKGKENTRKLYGLRLTPARKKHAKSCHLYTSMYLKEERISHGVRPVKTEDSKVSEDIPSVSVAMIKAEPAEEKLLPYHGKGGVQRRRVATEELKDPFAKKSYVKTLGSYEEKRIMKGSQVQQEAAQEEKDVKNPVGGYFANKAIDTAGSCTTKVKPFHFRTEKRVKDSRTDEGTYKKVQFPGLLRQQATQENNSTRTVTKPKPFHFETAKRVGKTAPKGDEGAPVAKRMCLRSSVQVPPLALKEASVGTEQKKLYKPKPRELPPSMYAGVLSSAYMPRPPVKTEVMKTPSEKRPMYKQGRTTTGRTTSSFHDHCAPKPTVEPRQLLASTSKPLSIPTFKAPATQKGTKGHTVIEPFSFDQKDQQRAQLKQKKISEAKEKPKSVFHFKAQQAPDFAGPSGIPPKAIKPSTKPAPFTFKTEKLAVVKLEKLPSGVIEEFQRQMQSAMSKAQSSLGAKMPPFQPEKSEKDPKGLLAEDPAKFEQSNIRAAQKKEEDNKKEAKKGVFHRV